MSSRLLPSDRAELARERLQKKLAQRQAAAAQHDSGANSSASSSAGSDSDASSEATINSDQKGRKGKHARGPGAAVAAPVINASATPTAAASGSGAKGKGDRTKDAAGALSKKDLVKTVLAKGSAEKPAPKKPAPKVAQAAPSASTAPSSAAPREVVTPAPKVAAAASATAAAESEDDGDATTTDPEYGEIEDPAPDPSAFAAQIYDYFIVLDYECTCDDIQGFDNEIIEFPAIMMDAVSGQIVSEFHSYVRPVRNPTLTRFCTKLTGITQDKVDAAEPFPAVLAAFEKWYAEALAMVTKSRLEEGLKSPPRIIVATDGPCDLELWLYRITHLRDGVPIPPVLMSYVDVKEVFAQKYGYHRKIVGMLQYFGLRFAGNQHSGLDDSRNLARVMKAMMQRGIVFARPVRVTDPGHRIPSRILNQTINSWERRVARGEVPREGWGNTGPNAHRSGASGANGPSPMARLGRAFVDFFFSRAAVPQPAARAQGKYLGGPRRHGNDRRQDDLATQGPLVPTTKGLSVLLAACAVTQALVLGGHSAAPQVIASTD